MQPMDEIYRRYARMVYRYLLSLCHEEDTAEELTQETFYQAIRSSGKYNGTCRISTWLCAIARNVFFTWKRKNPEHEVFSESGDEDGKTGINTVPSAEAQAMVTAQRVDVFKKIHLLPDPYKEVMYLRVFGSLSFREIADVLGKSENWARVTFYRGKEKLRSMLREQPADQAGKNIRKDAKKE